MNVQIRERISKNGSIRYQAVIEVAILGERKVVSAGTYGTAKEAIRAGEREAMKYETDLEKLAVLKGVMTLADWAPLWLANRKGTAKDSSLVHYRWRMDHWVLPYLGKITLNDLSPIHIRRWLDGLQLGNQSKKLARDALRNCLQGAIDDGALTDNPAKDVRVNITRAMAKAEKQAKPIKAWSHEDAQILLAACEGTRIEPLVVMGLLCGLRPGETQGLLWTDFDWLNATVTVARTRSETPDGIFTGTTKSGLSRTIDLSFETVRRMMAIRERQERGELRYEDPDQGVFTVNPSPARGILSELCRKLQIPILSPHSLRHTFASLAISGGCPITAVSEVLGHANAQITLSIYSHALPKDVKRVSSIVEQSILPRGLNPVDRLSQQLSVMDSEIESGS